MSASPQAVVAMDWGGTWIRVAVVGRDGEFLWQDRVPVPRDGTQEQLLEAAGGALRRGMAQGGPPGLAGLGVAVAGPVDAATGTLFDPPNLPALDGVSLKSLWETEFGVPVWVGNDANLAAVGEFFNGAGKEVREERGVPPSTLVYMTISTGVGGGVVDRGRMFLGTNGLAAEVGHMAIDRSPQAPSCQCGSRGCLESLASGTAIARFARERIAAGTPGSSRPSSLASIGSGEITSEAVFEAAEGGDPLAVEIIEGVVQSLGVGLTNILHLYNPDLVVLGGGVSGGLVRLGLVPKIRAIMDSRAMSEKHKEFRLVVSRLGDSVGIIGAAALAWESLRSQEL